MRKHFIFASLLSLLLANSAHATSWIFTQSATYANDPNVAMAVRFMENGQELTNPPPVTLTAPFTAPKTVNADALVGTGRRICARAKNVRVTQTTPVPTPDSSEVEFCANFPAELTPPNVPSLSVP